MNITVLGTGLMGAPLAERLASQGHSVTVWNRHAARAMALQDVSVASGLADAVSDAELLLLALSDFDAINAVLFEPGVESQLAGLTVLQMGTIAPSQSRTLEKDLKALGADYLEAPVLGSIPEAKAGTLIVMVGGERALFDRWLPVMQALGPKPTYIGVAGQAAALKLALNQMIAGLTASFALSLGLVRQAGIDVEQFMGILRDSALYAPTFDKKLQRMQQRDYAGPNFPVRHLLKDVNLFLDAAGEVGLDAGLLLALRELLVDTESRGLQDEDYSALYESIDPVM